MRKLVLAGFIACCGCAASDGRLSERDPEDIVRFATYNIHHWVGDDERADVARVARVIADMDVDVVALQEVDNNLVGEGDLRRQELFEELVDGSWVVFDDESTMTAHGNAVFVAPGVDVESATFVDVSEPGRDPRAFTDTVLTVRNQRFRLVGAHMGLKASERGRQIETLAAHLNEASDVDSTIVMGDFNEWNPLANTFRPLRALLRDIGTARTFPAAGPLFRLDRVFTSDHAVVEDVEVLRTVDSRAASDHLPVRAEVAF